MTLTSETVCVGQNDLYMHCWKTTNDPKAVALIYHGFLAHGLYPTVRYLAEKLQQAGYLVLSFDFPGHGQSSGLRGYLPSVEKVLELGVEMALYAKNVHGKRCKVFLLGSSLGGAIALSAGLKTPIDGVVLLAPMLKIAVSPPARFLLQGLSLVAPTWQIIPSSSSDMDRQCRDPVKRKECIDDPHVANASNIRVGSALTCVELASNIQEHFSGVSVPFLVLIADEDVVVDNQGALDLYEKAASQDKTKKNYPALHGLLCELPPLVNQIEDDVVEWINARA